MKKKNKIKPLAKAIRTINIFTIMLILISNAQAQFKKAGTTGYVFLEVAPTARSSGMGETTVALTDAGATALLTNPALLAFSNSPVCFSASTARYLADINHQTAAVGVRLKNFGFLGLSLNYMDFGSMTHTINADPENPGGSYLVLGTYTASAYALGLTFSRKLTQSFAFGLTSKFVRETIHVYHSQNLLLDLGMVYQTRFHSFRLGGYIQNFGVDAQYIGDSFKMPMIFRLGGAMEVLGAPTAPTRLTIAIDALHPSDYSERLHIGSEFTWRNTLQLRAGYKFNYDEEGVTAGAGMQWQWQRYQLRLDMSYTDFGRLGSVLRFDFAFLTINGTR